MESPKVSVIVPIYKAEKYIERCARSIFEQTMSDNVEFLFVNDATPDNSIKILEKVLFDYPKLIDQTRIIHNDQNIGVSQTRKLAISEAKGEYVAWVDSDDWIEPNMLETMWHNTQNGNVDIVVQNVYMDFCENEVLKDRREWKLYPATDPQEALSNYYTDRHVPWGLPFQMSRRSLIVEASKRVHDVNITEDAIMLIYLFATANSCAWLEKAYYHYITIENSTSLTHRNYQTKDEWNRQAKNVDCVSEYLLQLDKKKYKVTVNYIKWFWKQKFKTTFGNSWCYWIKYHECYNDIHLFNNVGSNTIRNKIKIWLKYNIYPIFWFKEGRHISFCE